MTIRCPDCKEEHEINSLYFSEMNIFCRKCGKQFNVFSDISIEDRCYYFENLILFITGSGISALLLLYLTKILFSF